MIDVVQDLIRSLPDIYAVQREIGRGGMATVFLADDRRHGRQVAIKVLRPEVARCLGADRFLREIQIVSRLNHPHILPLLDSGGSDGLLWYVMPYVEGETLRTLLQRERRLSIDRAVEIARDIAAALSWAHAHSIIHRDIKPENVLLEGGEAVVADFGLARAIRVAAGEELTDSGLVMGTPSYMSPEQAQPGAVLDGRSDVYSLGCTLYEMLAGQPPFLGPDPQAVIAQHLACTAPSLLVLRQPVPPWLDRAISKALAKAPADRFASADEFAAALTPGSPELASPRPMLWRVGLLAASIAVVLGAVGLTRKFLRTPPKLDKHLVAVAPFDAYDPELKLWREGMVDVLSANMNGAGPLRTLSPSVVIRDWRGRADHASALQLARRKGAGLVVFGRLLRSAGDTVRANAVLLDAGTGMRVGEVELRQPLSRIDRLGDSLALAILRVAGHTFESGNRHLSSLGAASLPALKAFLQGEHFLRRAAWDSAVAWYDTAIDLDSTFALALWRMKMARTWQNWGLSDPVGDGYALRAAAHSRGLAPRESLLITVDSLWASLSADDSLIWQRTRRLFATLDEAAKRYPTDPLVWYQIGDARYHLAPPLDFTMRECLDAFDRAIALDSGFTQAYLTHPVQLAMALGGVEDARRYTSAYLRVSSPGVEDSAARLSHQLMSSSNDSSAELDHLLERASADVLYRAASTLDMWFDSSETALRLARLMVQGRPRSPLWGDDEVLKLRLARLLAQRGHLRDSYAVIGSMVNHQSPADESLELFTELALLGAVPLDSARKTFGDWLRSSPRGAIFALPWWTHIGDSDALRQAVEVQESLATYAGTPARRQLARYGVAAARAYLALARADTLSAMRQFAALPDSLCQDCYLDWKLSAELLLLRGNPEAARKLFTRVLTFAWTVPSYPATSRLLGLAEERLGDRAAAAHAYSVTANAWAKADPSLRSYADSATKALSTLSP